MAKQKFPEMEERMFRNIFICMDCGARMRASGIKIRNGKVKCRKCRHRNFRPIKKEKKS